MEYIVFSIIGLTVMFFLELEKMRDFIIKKYGNSIQL